MFNSQYVKMYIYAQYNFLIIALQCFNLYSLIYKYICSTCNMWRCMPKRVTSLVTVIAPVSQRRLQPSFSYQSSSMSSSYQVSLSLRIYEFVSNYMMFCNVIMWTDSICVNIIFLSEFIFVLFFSSQIAGLCSLIAQLWAVCLWICVRF